MGIWEKTKNPKAIELMKKAFPEYKGRTFRVCTYPAELSSYWDGGSRDSYVIHDREASSFASVQSNHPFFEKDRPRPRFPADFPPSVVVVKHTIFCGKDTGLTLMVRPGEEGSWL